MKLKSLKANSKVYENVISLKIDKKTDFSLIEEKFPNLKNIAINAKLKLPKSTKLNLETIKCGSIINQSNLKLFPNLKHLYCNNDIRMYDDEDFEDDDKEVYEEEQEQEQEQEKEQKDEDEDEDEDEEDDDKSGYINLENIVNDNIEYMNFPIKNFENIERFKNTIYYGFNENSFFSPDYPCTQNMNISEEITEYIEQTIINPIIDNIIFDKSVKINSEIYCIDGETFDNIKSFKGLEKLKTVISIFSKYYSIFNISPDESKYFSNIICWNDYRRDTWNDYNTAIFPNILIYGCDFYLNTISKLHIMTPNIKVLDIYDNFIFYRKKSINQTIELEELLNEIIKLKHIEVLICLNEWYEYGNDYNDLPYDFFMSILNNFKKLKFICIKTDRAPYDCNILEKLNNECVKRNVKLI